MIDDVSTEPSTDGPRCPWCSAALASDAEVSCPSCGATLVGEGDQNVPGLTAIDADAILRAARTTKAKPRSRLMSWISGEYDDTQTAAPPPPGSLEPPSEDVRREMLRLELAAHVANLQAEAEAMAADATIEAGEIVDLTGASAAPVAKADAPDAADAVAATEAPTAEMPDAPDASTPDAASADGAAGAEDDATRA